MTDEPNHGGADDASHGQPTDANHGQPDDADGTRSMMDRFEEWEPWNSPVWFFVLIAALTLSVATLVLQFALPGTAIVIVQQEFTIAFLVGSFTIPVAIGLDAMYVADRTDWEPDAPVWVAACVPLFFNIVVALIYLRKRWQATPT